MYWKNFLRITRRNLEQLKKLGKLARNYQQELESRECTGKASWELPSEIRIIPKSWKVFLRITSRNLDHPQNMGIFLGICM